MWPDGRPPPTPWGQGVEEERDRAPAGPPGDGEGAGDAPARVLVVEDDRALRHIAERLLTHHGYAVATAPDGAAAIDIILRSLPFHLVVSDVVMPRMGGFTLVRWLAEHRPGTPVLLASGYVGVDNLEGQQIPDGVRLMRKPYAHADLIGAIQQLLGDGD